MNTKNVKILTKTFWKLLLSLWRGKRIELYNFVQNNAATRDRTGDL